MNRVLAVLIAFVLVGDYLALSASHVLLGSKANWILIVAAAQVAALAIAFQKGHLRNVRLSVPMLGFAGLGVGIGTLAMNTDACAPPAPIALMHIHGDDDDVVGTDGSLEGLLQVTPPAEAAAHVAANNGCEDLSQEALGDATCEVWSGCEAEVRYCLVPGLDHDWPDEEVAGFDGTEAMLDFFDAAR